MKPAYFDLSVTDVGAARRFFEAALDWRFERFDAPYEYWRIRAGAEGEPGIDGGLGEAAAASPSAGRPTTVLFIPVADLDAALSRVRGAGGRVVEPRTEIAGVGWMATCAEPGGLLFGLIEAEARSA